MLFNSFNKISGTPYINCTALNFPFSGCMILHAVYAVSYTGPQVVSLGSQQSGGWSGGDLGPQGIAGTF